MQLIVHYLFEVQIRDEYKYGQNFDFNVDNSKYIKL